MTVLFASFVPDPSVIWNATENGPAGCPASGVVSMLKSYSEAPKQSAGQAIRNRTPLIVVRIIALSPLPKCFSCQYASVVADRLRGWVDKFDHHAGHFSRTQNIVGAGKQQHEWLPGG